MRLGCFVSCLAPLLALVFAFCSTFLFNKLHSFKFIDSTTRLVDNVCCVGCADDIESLSGLNSRVCTEFGFVDLVGNTKLDADVVVTVDVVDVGACMPVVTAAGIDDLAGNVSILLFELSLI